MNKLVFAVAYLIVDVVWISTMSRFFYQQRIETIQKAPLRFAMIPAVLAYVTLLITMFFVCGPLATYYRPRLHPSIVFALVGFCLYGVYNFTNAAIFKEYDYTFVTVDTLWGVVSFAFFGYLYSL